jgi:hypothetical protein
MTILKKEATEESTVLFLDKSEHISMTQLFV